MRSQHETDVVTAQAQKQPELSSQDRPRRWIAPVLLALWTLFVWGGRLRNLVAADGGLSVASRWSLAGSVVFVGLAGLVLAVLVLRREPVVAKTSIVALGVFTIGVWIVRGVGIAIADHSSQFIAVHIGLALISITLAFWAIAKSRDLTTKEPVSLVGFD